MRITNKTEATKAIIPPKAIIDGIEYKVTEVAQNGFTSSSKLIRVSLPNTIKKIGNNAFSNCAKLNRINLANVEEIGNGAFNKCLELTEIVIPKSVKTIGTYILRSNNTQVKVRAQCDGENWAASWNKNNSNQDVEYDSKYVQPLELEPIYDTTARSANTIVGYSVAGGQPRNDSFYGISITEDNRDDVTEEYKNCIFIPAQYNGVDVLNIATWAFSGAEFDQLIVEYSETELSIGSNAFEYTVGTSIVINRPIVYYDEEAECESDSIFSCSEITSVALPNSITSITDSMFFGCEYLTNIYFIEPENIDYRDDELKIIDNQTEESCVVSIPGTSNIVSIGGSAFQGTTSITELHLYDTIKNVGAYVLADWYNGSQHVSVHNQTKITDWHPNWTSDFENITYDNKFYTVTFNPNGGKFVGSDEQVITKDVKYNKAIGNILPEIEKEENDFKGWCKDGVLFTAETVYTFDCDIELVADWITKLYTITFDSQGGEGGTVFIKVSIGDLLPDEEAPTLKGSTFMGYYEFPRGKGTRYYYDDMHSTYEWDIKHDITIYAHWEKIDYTVELYSGYDDNILLHTVENVHYEGKMPYAPKPERPHYDFIGYFYEMYGNGTQYYDADMKSVHDWDKADYGKLYAHWKPTEYQITYILDDGVNNPDNENSYNIHYTWELKDATHPTLYFNGWLYNGEVITSLQGLSGPITLVATYADIKHIHIKSAFTTLRVDATKTRIIFECAFSSDCIVEISSDVMLLEIYGNGGKYNMAIIADERAESLVLHLKNITITAPRDKCAIEMLSEEDLFLYNMGTVAINGYNSTDGDGGTAISCYTLIINTVKPDDPHNLTIKGGKGRDGGNGENGGNGGLGIIAESIIIACDYVTIAGGDGGNGGDGITARIVIKPVYPYRSYGGYGAYAVVESPNGIERISATSEFKNINILNGKTGKDGRGEVSQLNMRPINPYPVYTSPSLPGGSGKPVAPPLIDGGIIKYPIPYIPPVN